jgi:hypothetical protein
MKFFDNIFGVDEKKYVATKKEKPADHGQVQYIGGHKMYPTPFWTLLCFYEDRFELEGYEIKVYYSKIKDILNTTELKRDAERLALGVIALPLAAAYLWKKNHIYTIVEYEDDNTVIQKIVIDFGNNVNYAQALIYKRMLEARKATESNDK